MHKFNRLPAPGGWTFCQAKRRCEDKYYVAVASARVLSRQCLLKLSSPATRADGRSVFWHWQALPSVIFSQPRAFHANPQRKSDR